MNLQLSLCFYDSLNKGGVRFPGPIILIECDMERRDV